MLIQELERQGEWLFRWRSYVPLVLLPPAVLAIYLHRGYLGGSAQLEFWFELGCLLVSLSGLVIRAVAQGWAQSGSSGRNTRGQVAENLNTRGLYSAVRHPLYLGNMLMVLGVLLLTHSGLLAASGMLFYLLFYERIIATEERFLLGRFRDDFTEWAARTPALWPRFSQWQPSRLPFSWKAAIKGEFYGLTAIVAIVTAMDGLRRWLVDGNPLPRAFWLALLGASVVSFFVLRHLRKHTKLLEPAARREAEETVAA